MGRSSGTPEGDRLDVLATLIDAYEAERYAIDPPDSIEILSRPSNSVEQRNVSHQLETASRYLFAWGAVRDPPPERHAFEAPRQAERPPSRQTFSRRGRSNRPFLRERA